MWSCLGLSRPPQSCLPALREAPHASTRTRTHTRKSLQRSRRDCSMQRKTSRFTSLCQPVTKEPWKSWRQGVLTTSGMPRPGAAAVNGIVCAGAREDKERHNVELLSGDRCRLEVLATETGGNGVLKFVDNLAAARTREAPPLLQRSAFLAWRQRWTRMLAVSFANSLVAPMLMPHALAGIDGSVPLQTFSGEV